MVAKYDYNLRILTRDECIEREPGLEQTAVIGGSLAETEFVSEAAQFGAELVARLRSGKAQTGTEVDFVLGKQVTAISGHTITVAPVSAPGVGNSSDAGDASDGAVDYSCDRIILCNSRGAGELMGRQMIEPVYGYSVTYDNTANFISELGSLYYVTADQKRRLFSRFKDGR